MEIGTDRRKDRWRDLNGNEQEERTDGLTGVEWSVCDEHKTIERGNEGIEGWKKARAVDGTGRTDSWSKEYGIRYPSFFTDDYYEKK